MVAPFVRDLEICLSRTRLETYRPTLNGTDVDMLTNYFWNIDLAESLVPTLHAAELALRNTIHNTLTVHFANDMWFYQQGLLEPNQLGQFSKALGQTVSPTKPLTAGRVVAQLMFGFWTSLLSGKYDQRLWAPNGYALFQQAFPHAGANRRHDISQRFTAIAALRNRVAHYEAVWQRPNLQQEHRGILEAIGWIGPTLASAISAVDSFPVVYASKSQVRRDLLNHLGLPLDTL